MLTEHLTFLVDRRLMAVHKDWLCFRSDSRASLFCWQAIDFELIGREEA
ncbi:hypothetical protein [Caballeronia sp. LZ034LL]|nr:hypothetical protein [Caballeronia sp. LZ034LL]MDR5834408.1 hypothetical protein [Caballeronia sp. LZ034LL]